MSEMFASAEAAANWKRGAVARNAALQAVTDLMFERVAIVPGDAVLDIGCGTGDTTLPAAQKAAKNGRVVATDIARPMLDVCAEAAAAAGLDNVVTRQVDAIDVAMLGETFDVVIGRHSLQFVEPAGAGLGAIASVLRSGGRFGAVVWGGLDGNRYGWLPVATARRLGLLRVDEAVLLRPYALGQPGLLEELLTGAGFTAVHAESVRGIRRSDDVVEAMKWTTHGPIYLTLAATLDDDERRRLKAGVEADLAAFADGAGIAGPTEMLVVSARR